MQVGGDKRFILKTSSLLCLQKGCKELLTPRSQAHFLQFDNSDNFRPIFPLFRLICQKQTQAGDWVKQLLKGEVTEVEKKVLKQESEQKY